MKKTKGFTLVELVIVIVIVGILSIVAVPIYRGYTRKAMASEGSALVGSIQTSQKIYYAENGNFYDAKTSTGYDAILDVDARAGKYFKTFSVTGLGTGTAAGFTAATTADTTSGASNITVSLTGAATGVVTTTNSGI